jgi:hypothetical protein
MAGARSGVRPDTGQKVTCSTPIPFLSGFHAYLHAIVRYFDRVDGPDRLIPVPIAQTFEAED